MKHEKKLGFFERDFLRACQSTRAGRTSLNTEGSTKISGPAPLAAATGLMVEAALWLESQIFVQKYKAFLHPNNQNLSQCENLCNI